MGSATHSPSPDGSLQLVSGSERTPRGLDGGSTSVTRAARSPLHVVRMPKTDPAAAPARYLAHKARPPRFNGLVDRPRLGAAPGTDVVVLAAPSGYGKSALATQLAGASGRPFAWYAADTADRDLATAAGYLTRALAHAWPGLRDAVPSDDVDDVALARLAYLLRDVGGPGGIVLDDVDALPDAVCEGLLETVVATSPAGILLVVTLQGDPPASLLKVEAAGRAVVHRADDLRFDAEETARVLGDPEQAARVYEVTGGWPLAVGLAAARAGRGETPLPTGARNSLAADALAGLSNEARERLAAVAGLPRVPAAVLLQDVPTAVATELGRFATDHPSLVVRSEDGWWSLRDLLTGALLGTQVASGTRSRLARGLASAGETDLALRLLLDACRWDDAARLLEDAAERLLEGSRFRALRAFAAALPADCRSPAIRLADATAAVGLRQGSERELRDLRDEMRAVGRAESMRASALLAHHLLLEGDRRAFLVAGEELLVYCEDELTPEAVARRLDHTVAGAFEAAGYLLQALGVAMLYRGSRTERETGRAYLDLGVKALRRAGRDTSGAHALGVYLDCTSGGRPATDAIAAVEKAVTSARRRRHPHAAFFLLMLAHAQCLAGQFERALHTTEEAQEWAESIGALDVGLTARLLRLVAEVPRKGPSPELDAVAEELWIEGQERMRPTQMTDVALGLANAYLDAADQARAAHWLDRGRCGPFLHPYVPWQVEIARARLRLAEGDDGAVDELLSVADHQRNAGLDTAAGITLFRLLADQLRSGRDSTAWQVYSSRLDAILPGQRARVEAALAGGPGPGGAKGPRRRDGRQSPVAPSPEPILVRLLAREAEIERDGQSSPGPPGYAGRLLALLAAAEGPVTIDFVIECLWPGADAEAGRARLHSLLRRLRRQLGLTPDGPIRCEDGLVRLVPGPDIRLDTAEFVALCKGGVDDVEAAVALYRADFCAEQLAYEDFASDCRWRLRSLFLASARTLLSDRLDAGEAPRVDSTARRVWQLAPEDEDLCLLVVRVMTACGHRADATATAERTARALEDMGLPGDDLRAAAAAVTGAKQA